MQTTFALAALVGAVMAAPQASSSAAPSGAALGPAPAGCDKSYTGNFEITIVKPSNLKRDIAARQDPSTCGQPGMLTLNLQNGNLMDIDGRTGYIASANAQFQFDKPVQAGGEYAGEFSVCKNGSIALGPTTTFYQCKSGDFYNLYYANTAEQCSPVNIDIIPCDSASSSSAAPSTMVSAAAATSAKAVSVSSDGQPQATAKATSVVPVSVFSDGQPQATVRATSVKPVAVSEFTDGQPQATAAATMKSNVSTAAAPKATATIATAGGATIAASFSMAGLMAVFALVF